MVRSLLVATIKGLGCINLKIGYICFFYETNRLYHFHIKDA
jgi:hypothetical protein